MSFQVSGGAGHVETAAIAAVISAILAQESAVLGTPTQTPRQSSWVLAWRPRDVPAPLPSHTYDVQQWADSDPGARIESE